MRFRAEYLRITIQFLVGLLLLNLTTIGGYVISPFLPILRLDLPGIPGAPTGGQRVCNIGIQFRVLTLFWPSTLLVVTIAALILICYVVGRAMCGWLCPIGFIQDIITKIRNFLRLNAKEVSQRTHERLSLVKYAVLILTFLLAASIGIAYLGGSLAGDTYKYSYPGGTAQIAPYCSVCPAPDIYYVGFAINTGVFDLSDTTRYIGWFILGALVIGAACMPRFWCRYFCPMGALSSCFNKVCTLSLKKENKKCTKCNYCTDVCPTRVTKVYKEDKDVRVLDTDCIYCLECIEACPEKAVKADFAGKTIYKGGKDWWLPARSVVRK